MRVLTTIQKYYVHVFVFDVVNPTGSENYFL